MPRNEADRPLSGSAAETVGDMRAKANLHDVPPSQLPEVLLDHVQPGFRIAQITEWVHRKGVDSFDRMTNLPAELRDRLSETFRLDLPEVKERTEPAPDGSQKYLFTLADGALIESVFMPMRERTSICVSSQAGCAVGCTFCVTGFFGAGRNLQPSEIVGQYRVIREEHNLLPEQTNIVFMGMGEPLLNYDSLVASLETLYLEIAPKRITVSTSGIIPGIEDLAALDRRPNLAVSINAPDARRREEIMPITKKYPLNELMVALRNFPLDHGRFITAEYVLIRDFNDSPEDARALAHLLRGVQAKVNLIPLNEDANLPSWMKRPEDERIDRFADALTRERVPITVRRSKGRDIAAACGQLRGKTERRRKTTKTVDG